MNTTRLYHTVAAFMQARSEAREEYQKAARRYEAAKGSQMYIDEMENARETRDKTISDAQYIARREIRETINAMSDKAEKIRMQPPTEEQLRILQLLKMKDTLTEAECTGAANAMDGNAAALALLDEMAKKSGVIHVPFVRTLAVRTYSTESAKQAIDELYTACLSIVNNKSGASRPALLEAEHHKAVFGGTFDPFDLPQGEPFKDEEDFYKQMNIPLSAFSAAVD